jgi:2-aminoadipate transaminase
VRTKRGTLLAIPGPSFSANDDFDDALRLCFAMSTPERTDEGVARLKRAVEIAGSTR